MPLYIGSIVIKVADLPRAAAFWASALSYVVRGRRDALVDPAMDFVVLADPDGYEFCVIQSRYTQG
jgi:hypothetical protein